jgi:hypothetical protein
LFHGPLTSHPWGPGTTLSHYYSLNQHVHDSAEDKLREKFHRQEDLAEQEPKTRPTSTTKMNNVSPSKKSSMKDFN